MDFNNVLREKLKDEMSEFRSSYNDRSNIDVYNDWYIIGFYEAYNEVVTSGYFSEQLEAKTIEWLAKKEAPISYLYQKWMSCDGEMSHSWDDMIDWIIDVYLEEKHLEKQECHNNINALGLKDVSTRNDEYYAGFGCFAPVENGCVVFSANSLKLFADDTDKEFATFFKENLLVKCCDYGCDTYPDGVDVAVASGDVRTTPGILQTYQQQVWNFIEAVEQMFECKCHFYEECNGFEFAFEFGEGENKGCYVFAAGNNGQEYTETLYLASPEMIREPQITNTIIAIDKALYTLLEEHSLRREVPAASLDDVIKGAEAQKGAQKDAKALNVEQDR